jgi:hypothetical protein
MADGICLIRLFQAGLIRERWWFLVRGNHLLVTSIFSILVILKGELASNLTKSGPAMVTGLLVIIQVWDSG